MITINIMDKVDKTKVCVANVCEEDREIARLFTSREKEHIKRETSAVQQHCMKTALRILETSLEDNTTKRQVKKSTRIRGNTPTHEGYVIPPVFLQALTSH